jgi:hypothetical protein
VSLDGNIAGPGDGPDNPGGERLRPVAPDTVEAGRPLAGYRSTMAGLETIAGLSAREHVVIASSRGSMMQPVPDKLGALSDVVAALDSLGAAHAVVGGIAVGIRSGVTRATLDTDVAVRSTVLRDRIIETLTGAGFLHRGSHPHSINFRHASGEPVQIAIDPAFDAMIDRAELMDLGGIEARVVTTEDLISMKERAASDPGRRRSKALRDQADIALLRGDIPQPDEGW